MRVLIAVDGSAGSHQAARLVQSLAWPPDTTVTLLGVVDPGTWIPPGPGVPGAGGLVGDSAVQAYLEGHQVALSDELDGAGLSVTSRIVRGRPSDAVVAQAEAIDADLVVVGSRGHGKITALLLGSVSAAVVDRSRRSVLVTRSDGVSRVVLAIDGSRSARSAARIAADWSAFAELPITVVTVAEPARPWTMARSPAFGARGRPRDGRPAGDADADAESIAHEAVAGLRRAGRVASADVRRGDVPAEIVAACTEHDADLVVVGCRGRTSLRTFLLGSVARDVVLASAASVLVVRARRRRADHP